jgi:hypothetical protein
MNRHLDKGDEMKGRFTKVAWLIGAQLFCAPAQVFAEGCQAELQRASPSAYNMTWEHVTKGVANVVRQGAGGDDATYLLRKDESFKRRYQAFFTNNADSTSPHNGDALRLVAEAYDAGVIAEESGGQSSGQINILKAYACVARQMAANLKGTSGNTASNTNRTSPDSTATANSQQANRLNRELKEAEARTQNNQAKVDRARKGKSKRHVLGAEAHQCMSVLKGSSLYGGFINSCPYAIEYYFCAYHPKKDSWAEAFDCEANKFGAWQMGAGPGRRQSSHTNGAERIYWFACKYGPSLRKPDGISPADIEFQVGRGLLGRCAEWGSGGS